MSRRAHSIVPAPGTQIGDYEVIAEVGRGGMAVILSGRHVLTDEIRAIKLVLPTIHQEEVVKRFHLEYDILARLEHEGVLQVFETGEFQDRPYIVMEYVQGVELGAGGK